MKDTIDLLCRLSVFHKDGKDGEGVAPVEDTANTAEVIIAKNRHGSVGNVKMGWIGQFTKFRTLEDVQTQ